MLTVRGLLGDDTLLALRRRGNGRAIFWDDARTLCTQEAAFLVAHGEDAGGTLLRDAKSLWARRSVVNWEDLLCRRVGAVIAAPPREVMLQAVVALK